MKNKSGLLLVANRENDNTLVYRKIQARSCGHGQFSNQAAQDAQTNELGMWHNCPYCKTTMLVTKEIK